jgi:diacylglycerol kinase (ATP)
MASKNTKKLVRVLVNPRSGVHLSFENIRKAVDKYWENSGHCVQYQFLQGIEDAVAKAEQAVEDEVDIALVAGGDGTVNSIGRALIGSRVALGIIPTGSGNGFARHFAIPLGVDRAVKALAGAEVRKIDVGYVNEAPFLVTCSMAWDASIVRSFEKSLMRGVLPYVFAGVNEYFGYDVQPMVAVFDTGSPVEFDDPMVFTVANLSQYGGGAIIAPDAKEDDGQLELIVALKRDMPRLVSSISRLFDGTANKMSKLYTRRFRHLHVRRMKAAPIQVDGELLDAGAEVDVRVVSSALRVLVPKKVQTP